MISGLPRKTNISSEEVREALKEPIGSIIDCVTRTLEKAEPELAADLVDNGIVLAGGGSLLLGMETVLANATGLDVTLAHPPEFKLLPEIMKQAKEQAKKYGGKFEVVDDMKEGFKDADIVYAKSWGPLLTTQDPEEGKKIQDKYKDWITDAKKMALADKDAIYMHPLPADRDVEVTSEVMDGPQSVVFDQAENRMHAQKAVMALTMR